MDVWAPLIVQRRHLFLLMNSNNHFAQPGKTVIFFCCLLTSPIFDFILFCHCLKDTFSIHLGSSSKLIGMEE